MRFMIVQQARLVIAGAFLAAGASAWFCTGCKPSAEKQAVLQQRLAQEIEDQFAKIQESRTQGQLSEALARTDAALANPKFAAQKNRFFTLKIELVLAQAKEAAAEDLVIGAWPKDPQAAKETSVLIHNHYLQRNNQAASLAWCKRLLDLGPALPEDLRNQALGWRLTSALSLADQAAALAGMDDIIRLMSPEEGTKLLQQTIGDLINAGQHTLAVPLIARLSEQAPEGTPYRQLAVLLNMRRVLATADWAHYTDAFNACVAQLPDTSLFPLTRQIYSSLQKNNRKDLVEQSSKFIVFSSGVKTNSVNLAARQWVECGVSIDKKLLPERLEALLKASVSPVQVGSLFDRYFYEMVNDLDIIRSLCSLGERILAVCSDEATVNNLKVKILDGAFIVENYDLAVQMLEKGIPGKDKLWHDMSLPKVKAHRALAQKNPREAVKYFREFMDCWINSKQEEEYDPTSGIAYSKEWILGRNANRIANILDSIPDKAEADKAREEAKNYFRTAIKKAAADAEATKLIKEETKDMGL